MRHTPDTTGQQCPYRYCGWIHVPEQCTAYGKTCIGYVKKVCHSKRDQAIDELEVEEAQEVNEGEVDTVSIDSVHLNKNQSLITTKLETQAGRNTIEIPYKIDTGSEGSIMLLFLFKKLFRNTTEEQWQKSIQSPIRLKMYNKTHTTQLGTGMVVIEFKNIKKRCVFFVVPGNGQVLLGMLHIAALKLININIDSIQVEMAEYKTNTEQEMHMVKEDCANTDADSKIKQGTNSQNGQNNTNKPISYFFLSSNVDADKRKGSDLMQKIHNTFGDVLMALGALKAHSLCSLNQTASCIKCHPGVWCMHYKNHSRRSWNICQGWTSSPL